MVIITISVLLFGLPDHKDAVGSASYDPEAPVQSAVRAIKREVPADRLVYWELGDGWEPLADALGVEAPDKPFPHLHDTNEFRTEFGLPALA